MYKILVVNIDIRLKDEKKNFIEFEPTELNKLLNDGWEIIDTKTVESSQNFPAFSLIYKLSK